ncbi:MAG: NGG1p interacting factor NIF3 [Acidobacteriota bacterium]|nr:NGG1p interacting factor NIF3 [Acidobacteriota bacterium]
MKLKDFYQLAITAGIKNDMRPAEEISSRLQVEKEKYNKLSDEEKEAFDLDAFFNPYADSRILTGNPEIEVKHLLAGIDIEVGEVLLAHVLNKEQPKKFDLILAHHPAGRALAQLYQVMGLQVDLFIQSGVTPSLAEQLMENRMGEVERRFLPLNHNRTVDVARLLNLPMICLHTVADNCVTRYLTDIFTRKAPARLKEVLSILKEIPEYRKSSLNAVPPRILNGSEESRAGRIYVDMTGGTEGPKDIFDRQVAAGVSSLVGMHFSEEALKKCKAAKLNVIVAGHIASDTLGLNLLLDQIETAAGEGLEVTGISGFERIKHV